MHLVVHGGGRTMVEDAIDWETHVFNFEFT